MRKVFVYVFLILITLVFFDSCKGKREMVKKDTAKSREAIDFKDITERELDYSTIEIKCATKAELDGNNYALNITYRNVKNEKIWASVRAMLGIEAARIYADRDSLWIVSKIAQVKEKGSWREMSKTLGYPLDFMAFQAIMSRKVFYPGTAGLDMLNSFILKDLSTKVMLFPDSDNSMHRKSEEQYGYLPKFTFQKDLMKLMGTTLSPENNKWMLDVVYSDDFESNKGIGKSILLEADDSQTKMNLDLKIQQVKLDEPLKMPFQWF